MLYHVIVILFLDCFSENISFASRFRIITNFFKVLINNLHILAFTFLNLCVILNYLHTLNKIRLLLNVLCFLFLLAKKHFLDNSSALN